MLPNQNIKLPIFLFLVLTILFCCTSIGSAAVIDVGPGYSYTTIASGMAAASAGDYIHVHSGTYTISSTIQPSKADLTLYGDGYNNTIIKAAAYDTFDYDSHSDPRGSMIYISGSSPDGFEIYGFKIDGSCADNTSQHDVGGTTDGGSSITVRGGAAYISIHDIYFTLGMGDCIFGGGSSHVDVYNCIMLRPGHDGIQLWGSTTWNITNCIIDRQTNSGIRLATSTKNINISRVTMYTTQGGGYADIEWEGADSGNTVDHCVFNAVGPVIADYSGSGTMGFTNNICYNIALPSNPTGSVTLSPNTGNQYTTTTWDWMASGYGYNPGGVTGGNGTGEPMATYNGTPAITLTYPTNGSAETTANNNTTFAWSNVNSSSYRIVVANNSSFAANNTIYNQTTSSSSISLALSQNETYWWKVQGKIDTNNTWTNYTTPWTFTVVGNREIAITSGIYGYVYDTSTTNVIAGAVVTIMNTSWSETYVTKADGYYEFSVPRDSGVYYLRASATDYQTSPDQLPLNLTGEYVYENIALTKSPSYFVPHYVTFTVTDIWGILYENVSVTIYRPGDLDSPYMAGYTDSSGAVTFALNQTTLYTIVLYDAAQNIDRTLTLSPGDTAYNLWVWNAHKVSNTTSNIPTINASSDFIRCSIQGNTLNLTNYDINVSVWSLGGNDLSAYNITVKRIYNNNGTWISGTPILFDDGTGNINNFTIIVPSNYTYSVTVWAEDPDYLGGVPVYFFKVLYADGNPIKTGYQWFDWDEQWHYTVFAYCLMLMAGGLFGRANANVGALLVGFIGMFSWYTGWIQYSLGDKIMAMFGVLILIIYLLSRKD